MTQHTLSDYKQAILDKAIAFVKQELCGAEGGHDWFHTMRVWQNSKLIAANEDADLFVVELAALLHDIADSKFHDGNEEIGPKKAESFLNSLNADPEIVSHVVNIIQNMSFRKQFDATEFTSKELRIVQDADRLDAIGAIGIARAFSYGGHKGRAMYDPGILPDTQLNSETYKKSTAPTINHFYEKLLLLKERMNTETGKRLALKRHQVMEQFLADFFQEWNAEE